MGILSTWCLRNRTAFWEEENFRRVRFPTCSHDPIQSVRQHNTFQLTAIPLGRLVIDEVTKMRRELLIMSTLLASQPALALDDAAAFEAVLADGKIPLEDHEKLHGCDFWAVRDTLSSLTRCTDKRAWIFTVSEFEKKPEQILAKHFVLVCRVENSKSLGLATEIYRLKSGKYAGGLAELVSWEKTNKYILTVQSPFLARRSPSHPELIKLPDACDPFRKEKR